MATKQKKDYYYVGGEWKLLTKEEFQKEYNKAHPVRATVLRYIGKLFTLSVTLAFLFLLITVVYALFKWAIGVWV